ncbi:heavy metal-associated isoprenylated plant protein 41-like isoform X2 [Benincasa hispida]|uniref:heavy metal-associated isoprenylated plant protein 41-like isoform X2 n=1 Tax=Benincasa hispida TaxID=102211 RepID=UPI001902541E|nr:heavy metal-associated isoprenylated plant protein 41-like isoform X2 [Benincasa hispida]
MFINGRQPFVGPPADSGEKWLKYYCSYHDILLVGEGNFSFSVSLAMSFGSASNIVATSLDSYVEVVRKYKNARLNLRILKGLGASILHEVDATKMKLHIDLRMRKFDRIIFNFRHAGFFGREDSLLMIRMHKRLVHEFFKNASQMLRVDGEIHVNHKTKAPFSDWNIVQLAHQNSLALIGCADFNIQDYPGYHNKRGQGNRCDHPFFLDMPRNLPFPEIPISNHYHHPYPTSFGSGYCHTHISMQDHPTRFDPEYSCATHSVNAHSRFMTGMLERMSNDNVYWSSNLRSNFGEEIERSDARTMPRLFHHW